MDQSHFEPGELSGFPYVKVPGEGKQDMLLLHGTGADEYDLLQLGSQLFAGSNLVSPRGRVMEGSMTRWFARLAPGVFDTEDLLKRAEEFYGFIEAARKDGVLTDKPLWVSGFSNGANFAAALVMLYPETFAGAVLLRAMMPFNPESPPEISGTPVYLASGSHDQMISRDRTLELADFLRTAGADLTHVEVPSGHNLIMAELQAIREWFAEKVAD